MRKASIYADGIAQDADHQSDKEKCIFEDRFEEWESNAIDGKGQDPPLRLGEVKRNKQSRFRLQGKYKNLFFVDKDPDNENKFYESDSGADPLPAADWEHRKILGLALENNRD